MTDIPDDVRAWLVRLDLNLVSIGERIDLLESAFDDATATGDGDLTATAAKDWVYRNVHDWVEQWFTRIFARNALTGARWCPQWWDHGEALVVLTALWRTWETLRRDRSTGIGKWLTTFAYPLIRELMDAGGTFGQCGSDHHMCPPALPYVTASDERRRQWEV